MKAQHATYRGFIITIGNTQNSGWCAVWQEMAGDTIHQSFNHPSEEDAQEAATEGIDRYYEEIEKERRHD